MKTNKSNRSLQRFGVSAIVAGAILFSGSQVGAAEKDKEFGEKLLYNGKTDQHVVELKELLEENDFLSQEAGEWSQEYDQATTDAVTEFQEEYDLLVDGLAGIQTVGALTGLERGDESELVLALQEDLAELGYYNYDLDSKFGPITEEALINFQNDESVEDEEGVAGPHTYSALHDMTSRYNPNISAPEAQVESSTEQASEPAEESNESTDSSEPAEESSSSEPAEESSSSEPAEESSEADQSAEESSQEESSSSESNETEEQASSSSNDAETTMTLEATAYTAYCDGCSGITYTGIDLRNNPNKKVVAVDPDVIPLGSIVEVEGYGRAIAGDIGGAIQGNRIDLHVATKDEAFEFGRKDVEVTVVETP
ncbi:peptidoglycan-binding protein [Salipaludibacillus keqinensis]|uniref:Peptidoglycan-binding protein n=1 Tax=Salipaludibacillus keqinensis TaxID=2045207 RepID=A0A323TGS0_9BACI|nr:peptidoglycan-binding protein [Salipaludibacillus keqinensis]PYZ94051.1 peptidoglycan-binding protein [Salipaludibacillus keqinensis]